MRTIPPRRLLLPALALAAAAAIGLSGCSGTEPDPGTESQASTPAPEPRTLTVFAAASLTETFTTLAAEFEQDHPGVTVSLVFDGSSGLASQLTEGAPADVFAAANESTMQTVVDAELAQDPQVFVSNVLEIATLPGNPSDITSFADLANPDLKLVVCAVEVPCGAATDKIEKATGIQLSPVSEENAVTDVLGKVTSGEADAGLVYATDVLTAGDAVTGVPFAEADEAINKYPIVALTGAPEPELAAQFVEFILGPDAQERFEEAGFRAAP
ncbi:molybdate ABC transporter substrate-binding protein [Microbacterium sp.]|uniref:molybdate ABC transporter substrate-binding protein n=1 Tax=Microbacterium sp. TaxID=51671 RepID=UPI003C779F4C